MLGQFKPVAFEPYGKRSAWRPPRWLVLLLLGVAAGVGGVVWVQEKVLPPRLSVQESAALRTAYEQAERERQRLRAELDSTAKQLAAALDENKAQASDLAGTRQSAERLRDDLTFAVAALPPDPRGGTVEVRAARLTRQRGALAYEVLLTRERATGKPLAGVMQMVVSGAAAGGVERRITLQPINVSVASHQTLRGSLPLPDDLTPRQTTINILDRVDGRQLGMRVMIVQ